MSSLIHLVLGGARSGKSRRAQELAERHSGEIVYIATCATTGLDPEMESRIEIHKNTRPCHWKTVENRFNLVEVMQENSGAAFLLDCLTLWLAYWQGEGRSEAEILSDLETALKQIRQQGGSLFIVSNELGMGLVPMGTANRGFRDLNGRANQLVAGLADHVEFLVAGLPWKLK